MSTCPCGATGFYNRRDLAKHLLDKHGVTSPPRALVLAQRIIDKLTLSPEDCAVLGIEPRSPELPTGTRRERQQASETRELVGGGLPADKALDRALEEAGHLRCARCNERPPMAGQTWCTECLTEVGKAGAAKRARPPKKDPARVAQLEERRGATPEVTGSSPVPRSTPTAGAAGESARSQETPMAEKTCKACKKPFTPKHHLARYCSDECNPKTKTTGETKAPKPKKATGGGKHRAKRKPKPAGRRGVRPEPVADNGHRPIELKDDAAREAGKVFLGHLYRVRDRFNGLIKNVEAIANLV